MLRRMSWRIPKAVSSEEGDAGDEDGSEGGLPGNVHLEDNGVGEVGVESHAGREGDGIAGDDAHEDAAECGRQAGGGGDGGERDSGFGENGGVHQDDVSHGDEGSDAGEELRTPVCIQTGEFKIAFESGAHGPSKHRMGNFQTKFWGGARLSRFC